MNQQYPLESIPVKLEEVVENIEVGEAKTGPGRPRRYSNSALVRFHVYRFAKGGWSVRRMRRELKRQPKLRRLLGMPSVPSLSTLSERSKYLPWQELWAKEAKRRIVVIDATPLLSSTNDADAKWGMGSDDKWFYGYKLYLLLDADTGEVLGLELKTANCNESPVGRELLKGLPKAKGVALADAAYDAAANFRTALVRGYHLLTSTNPRRGEAKQAPRQLNAQTMRRPEMKALFKKRLDIERVFGVCKDVLQLAYLRVQGFAAVKRHVLAAITAFSVLAQALTAQGCSMLQVAQIAA